MKETPFEVSVSGGKVRGFMQDPGAVAAAFAATLEPRPGNGAVVVILHGWIGYCAGPHRILYELAEYLCRAGFATVRFDFFGRGDSDGGFEETTFRHAVEDTRRVVEWVKGRFGDGKIDMVGMCFGATVGFRCCDLWGRMALWSPGIVRSRARITTRLHVLKRHSGRIVRKILSPSSWDRILTGKSDIRRAYRYYTRGATLPYAAELPTTSDGSACSAMLIFGGTDPALQEADKQYAGCCDALGIPQDTRVIRGADHSFCSVVRKRELIRRTARWLLRGRTEPESKDKNDLHD